VPSLAVTVVGLLINVIIARQQCLCPRGATAIRLATVTINKYIWQLARSLVPSLAVTAVGLLLVQVSRDRLFHSADIVREPFHTLLSEGRLLSWYSLAIWIHLSACYYAV